jgi:DNA-directed RNA polymerase subunit M/transcription elongation factor TFIIS
MMPPMWTKTLLTLTAVAALCLGGAGPARAADESPPSAKAEKASRPEKPAKTKAASSAAKTPTGPEVTLKGDLTCAKCGLHEASICQNVLRVKEGEKEVKYYLAKNAVAEENHEKVCGGSAPATVTGKLSSDGAKKVITPSAVKFD